MLEHGRAQQRRHSGQHPGVRGARHRGPRSARVRRPVRSPSAIRCAARPVRPGSDGAYAACPADGSRRVGRCTTTVRGSRVLGRGSPPCRRWGRRATRPGRPRPGVAGGRAVVVQHGSRASRSPVGVLRHVGGRRGASPTACRSPGERVRGLGEPGLAWSGAKSSSKVAGRAPGRTSCGASVRSRAGSVHFPGPRARPAARRAGACGHRCTRRRAAVLQPGAQHRQRPSPWCPPRTRGGGGSARGRAQGVVEVARAMAGVCIECLGELAAPGLWSCPAVRAERTIRSGAVGAVRSPGS